MFLSASDLRLSAARSIIRSLECALYYIVYLLTISPVLRFSPHVGLIGAIVADYTGGWATLSSRALTRRALDASIEFRQY